MTSETLQKSPMRSCRKQRSFGIVLLKHRVQKRFALRILCIVPIVEHKRQSAFVRTKYAVHFESFIRDLEIGGVAVGLHISLDDVGLRRNFSYKSLGNLFWAVPHGNMYRGLGVVVKATPKTPEFFGCVFVAGNIALAETFQFVLDGHCFDSRVFQLSFYSKHQRHCCASSMSEKQVPAGLPSWIINCKLKYMEPIPIPKSLAEYYFFVDQQKDFIQDNQRLDRNPTLVRNHKESLEKYERVIAAWIPGSAVDADCRKEFLNLESQMRNLLPTAEFQSPTDVRKVCRDRIHCSIPLPKFICNQFLFGDEPIKPPEDICVFNWYYGRNWSNRSNHTDKYHEKRADIRNKKMLQQLQTDLFNVYPETHKKWYDRLSSDAKIVFKKYNQLRTQIKKLCPSDQPDSEDDPTGV